MGKEKKKQQSVGELSRGGCILLVFSPVILFALYAVVSITLQGVFNPQWYDSSIMTVVFGAMALVMVWLLTRSLFRARWLWKRIRLLRAEMFRVEAMQDKARHAESRLVDLPDVDDDYQPDSLDAKRAES